MTAPVTMRPPAPSPLRQAARLAAITALASAALAGATPAAAATMVEVSTPYPAVAVEPGATASFTISVRADTRERVDLRLSGVPEGWEAELRGGGFVVDGVFADPDDPPEVTLDIDVPADAEQGDYPITVTGTAPGASNALRLDIRVAETAAGQVSLTADFPQLQGPSDATFNFDLTLQNDTPEEVNANLDVQGAPEGWQVTARPAGQEQAASATVDAGGSTSVTVSVDPTDDAAAGDYPLTVVAAGGARTAETQVTVTITGSFSMTLTTPDERLNATVQAGATRDLTLRVANTGTAPLVGVQVSATPPTGWNVTFDPATIAEIPPQDAADITAHIQPSGDAVAGDYVVTFSAQTAETSADANIRTTVETSFTWAIVGGLLIVGTLLALGWVFQRYGRR